MYFEGSESSKEEKLESALTGDEKKIFETFHSKEKPYSEMLLLIVTIEPF
jgi:hypothetical protein